MTLEQSFYEYKPYAYAFIGMAAIAHLNSGMGSFSGTLLVSASIFIAYARYHARYVRGVKPQVSRAKTRGRITRPSHQYSSQYRRLR